MSIKLNLVLLTSLLSIGMSSAFAQNRSSLPADWKSQPNTVTERVKTPAPIKNINNPGQTPPVGSIILPKEFISSCMGKSEGVSCEFPLDSKKVKGICGPLGASSTLGCKASNSKDVLSKFTKTESTGKSLSAIKPTLGIPDDPYLQKYTPPKELISSCTGKSVGNSCEASLEGSKLKGACSKVPFSSSLVCQPPLPKNLNSISSENSNDFPPTKACEGKPKGNSCSIVLGSKKISGVCTQEPTTSKVMCIPTNMK